MVDLKYFLDKCILGCWRNGNFWNGEGSLLRTLSFNNFLHYFNGNFIVTNIVECCLTKDFFLFNTNCFLQYFSFDFFFFLFTLQLLFFVSNPSLFLSGFKVSFSCFKSLLKVFLLFFD